MIHTRIFLRKKGIETIRKVKEDKKVQKEGMIKDQASS
jgi:hypothetical protein